MSAAVVSGIVAAVLGVTGLVLRYLSRRDARRALEDCPRKKQKAKTQ